MLIDFWSIYSWTDDSILVCQRLPCQNGDVDCVLNLTSTIKHLYVALPSISQVLEPMSLVTVRSVRTAANQQQLSFRVLAGNDENYFEMTRDRTQRSTGYTRLCIMLARSFYYMY